MFAIASLARGSYHYLLHKPLLLVPIMKKQLLYSEHLSPRDLFY